MNNGRLRRDFSSSGAPLHFSFSQSKEQNGHQPAAQQNVSTGNSGVVSYKSYMVTNQNRESYETWSNCVDHGGGDYSGDVGGADEHVGDNDLYWVDDGRHDQLEPVVENDYNDETPPAAEDDPADQHNQTTSLQNSDCSPNKLLAFLSGDSNWISSLLMNLEQTQKEIPRDHVLPFDKFAKLSIMSKGEACIKFQEMCARHCLKDVIASDILEWLSECSESLNLPVVGPSYLKELADGEKPNFKHNLKKYTVDDERSCVFDVCKRECIVFHGLQDINGVPVDCSKLINCPHCKLPRYSKCTHADCITRDYENCNPHNRDTSTNPEVKHHSVTYRVPMRSVYYRFIIPKLLQLYSKSLTKGHENLLNYRSHRIKRKDCYIDIQDGTEVENAYTGMFRKFEQTKQQYFRQHRKQLHECSVAITIFYDGKTNFKRSSDSMHPMIGSITNCNPTDRSRLGVGMFLISLHNCKPGSRVEDYLLDQVMGEELRLLENGIVLHLTHPETGEEHAVFLQARLLYAHLDSVELQKFFKVQGAGSDAGCGVCRQCPGNYRNCMGKHVYVGHRAMLHPNHILRCFGQAQRNILATQKEFYKGLIGKNTDYSKVKFYKHKKDILKDNAMWEYPVPRNCVLNKAHLEDDSGIFTELNLWCNYKFPASDYVGACYYQMPDSRIYGSNPRVSTTTYLTDGAEAELTHKPVNGVNGINKLVLKLNYFKFEYAAMHDLMHAASNASVHSLELHKGLRGLKHEHKALSIAQETFPFLQFDDMSVPWRLTAREKVKIDSLVNCCLVPAGYKTNFNIEYPMCRTGHMRAKDHIIFMTVLAPFMYTFTRLTKAYKSFTARYGDDLARLLNPCIHVDEVDALTDSIIETRCIMEGIYPECMQFYIYHQIIDIVRHIKKMGHVRGIMCFGGERALSTMGRAIGKGGVNYLKSMFVRYVALENSLMSKCSNKNSDPDQFDNSGSYNDFVLKLSGDTDSVTLNDFQRNHLLIRVCEFLASQNIDRLGELSSMYRMFVVFEQCQKNPRLITSNKSKVLNFGQWLKALHYAHRDDKSKTVILSLVCSVADSKGLSTTTILDLANQGIIMNSDLALNTGIIHQALSFSPIAYTRAVIKGLRFRGRGSNYCEKELLTKFHNGARREIFPSILENNIECDWHKTIQYSAWFRFTDKKRVKKDGKSEIIVKRDIGQFNYFFRLKMPCDPLVHGLAFADVALHKAMTDLLHNGNHYISANIGSYNQEKMYVCLNYVDGTALMVCPMDVLEVPICHSERYTNATFQNEKGKLEINNDCRSMNRLYFLPMHPERMGFEYRTVLNDEDRTKFIEPAEKSKRKFYEED